MNKDIKQEEVEEEKLSCLNIKKCKCMYTTAQCIKKQKMHNLKGRAGRREGRRKKREWVGKKYEKYGNDKKDMEERGIIKRKHK